MHRTWQPNYVATGVRREVISRAALLGIAQGVAEDSDSEPTTVTGDGFTLTFGGLVAFEDYLFPAFVEIEQGGHDGGPTRYVRVEMRDDGPALVELRFTSAPGNREIRQADLRTMTMTDWVEDFIAGFTFRLTASGELRIPTPDTAFYVDALHAAQRSRAGKATRTITRELLVSVADIYRRNVADRPTKAVQRAYGVSPRMASEYVQRARRAGLLPATTRGRKKA